jgi:hypothetical protein
LVARLYALTKEEAETLARIFVQDAGDSDPSVDEVDGEADD